jgi:DNA (cytosine-5)-methyltransferase 1
MDGDEVCVKWRMLDLFSGIGGFSLAAQWCWGDELEIVAFCEIDKFCQKVLKKHWPNVPIVEDVKNVNKNEFGPIDIICGGFPCQDISVAGHCSGLAGKRSGLWNEYAKIIGKIRPKYVVVENVSALLFNGLGTVLGNLSECGYDAEWYDIPAYFVGAPHQRRRLWIIAYPDEMGRKICFKSIAGGPLSRDRLDDMANHWKTTTPEFVRMDDGISKRLDKLRIGSLGNAIVPQVAYQIMKAIKEIETNLTAEIP